MSRTLTSGMQAHLAGTAHSRVWMLRLDLDDGTVIGLTSYDVDVPFDLGDGAGSVTYQSRTGAKISDVELTVGLAPSNFEVSGPIAELVTLEALLGGRFNRAQARLFQANPRVPADGPIRILFGHVTEARPQGGEFVMEVRNEADRFNQIVGETITPQCKADYGDARCGAVVEFVDGTVTAVTDELTFAVSYAGSHADDFFNFGKVEWLTGELAGIAPIEVHDWSAAGQLVLFAPLPELPAIGATCRIKRGCPRSRTACMARGRILFFRGYPELPGSDQILRAAIPGQGNA